ncbi:MULTISPECIES: hypothetical protein [Microbacteriaceae]|uniref:WXG100 family type VII secretion target n=1 Tax=Orlajensenia leifsoniae TaxID=2561933 RepID=A0A4Y9R0G6_9MICO|nr:MULTISPECIES: hypothetical protein [Leifsonia]KQQ92834.1 hypothetical protein ASF62_13595 [Leifsonia sp. Leaf325]TFV96705.1 hypothetical protein E4M00_11500 [Leifsonia flava]
MAFAIDPSALNTHAKTLRTLSDAVPPATSYVATNLSLTIVDTAFLFAKALDAANQTKDAIRPYLTDLANSLDLSADELDATATRSIELDDAIERDLDAAYPEPVERGTPMSVPTSRAVYVKPSPPGDALVTPAGEPPSDLVSVILTTDWLSPSTVVAQILDWIFDWNYLDEISKKFSGDWNSLFRVTHALESLKGYHVSQSENIGYAMSVGANTWTGQGADAANAFFTEMARLVREAGDEIGTLAPEFEVVARGMHDTAALVADLFAQILDAAIAAAFFYIAGTVLVETVVGTVIGYLAGTGTLAYMAWLAHEAYDVVQSALLFFDALGAGVAVFAQFLAGGVELPKPLPYDNPTV